VKMAEEFTGFSGVTIVIFIACGVLTFVLLFLFGKREISRFALKNRRGPHVPIGHDAPKLLRRTIDDRLSKISDLLLEPRSLQVNTIISISATENLEKSKSHYYRMKALDDVKIFEERLREKCPHAKRKSMESLRSYLFSVMVGGVAAASRKTKLIHNLCDAYEHARHNPKEFGPSEYNQLCSVISELHL